MGKFLGSLAKQIKADYSNNGFRMPTNEDLGYEEISTTLDEKRAYLNKLVVDSSKYNIENEYGLLMESGSMIFEFDELYKMVESAKGTNTFYIISKASMLDEQGCLVDVAYEKYSRDKERYFEKKGRGF